MRILGLDYGAKRIGVAISDPLGITAQPLTVITTIEELKPILEHYQPVSTIVVGWPKTLSGQLGPQTEKVREFIQELKNIVSQPIITWDERLTSAAANKMLISAGASRKKRKQVVDKTAAALILQSYLDSQKK